MSIAGNTAALRLRELLNTPGHVVACPGVYDGLSARLALSLGFEALYLSGGCTSMSRLGFADLGLITYNDMVSTAEMVANLDPTVPIIADADTGYGGPIMVARTVQAYARAGVAALHLEDQVQEKRCGQLIGKQLVDREVWYSRLRAAIAARDEIGSKMLIIARTDARESLGFDEAVARLQHAAELGADVAFLEAVQSHDEAKRACELLHRTPVLLNMVPNAVTPDTSIEEARSLGFRLMIFPGVCIEPAVSSALAGLQALKRNGRQEKSGTLGPKEIFRLCGLQQCIDIDKKAQGRSFDTV